MLAALALIDDAMDLADSLDDDPHTDPNQHFAEVGCLICRDTLVRIRAAVADQAGFDLALWKIELGAVDL